MSAPALVGLGLLNMLFLLTGVSLLGVVRGWDTWTEIGRLAGLAYVTGVAATGSIWTLLLIFGAPFSLALVLGLPMALIGGSALLARRRGRTRPHRGTRPQGRTLVAAAGVAATALLLAGFFRAARLSGLYWWDAWSFWVPKAKAIYYFGELEADFFTTLPNSSYPPLVPVLDAAAFHVMASADVVTLHVQYWFFGVGFVWALAGLLAERVSDWILWPFVLLVLVSPRIGERFLVTEADLFLDYLFVVAAVLVFLWILDREHWRIVLATVAMCGMVLTKREGLLLAAVLVTASLLASARQWRSAWPTLIAATAVAAAVAAPWRIWYIARGVAGEAPPSFDPTDTERLWPSFRLAFDVLFSSDYWSILVPIAIGALVLAALVRAYTPVVFFGALILLVTLGGGWITWAIPELEITQEHASNPIVRYMGAAALLCAAASPLLLAAAWRAAAVQRAARQ